MNKLLLLIALLCFLKYNASAQHSAKRPITLSDITNWNIAGNFTVISPDGQYWYRYTEKDSLEIRRTDGKLVGVFTGLQRCEFTAAGQLLASKNGQLQIVNLKNLKVITVPGMIDRKLIKLNDTEQLFFRRNKELGLLDLKNGKTHLVFKDVENYWLNDDAGIVLCQGKQMLQLINLRTDQIKTLGTVGEILKVTFGSSKGEVAWIEKSAANRNTVKYFDGNRVRSYNCPLQDILVTTQRLEFTGRAGILMVTIEKKPIAKPQPILEQVAEIWDYRQSDSDLPSATRWYKNSFMAAIDFGTGNMVQVEQGNDEYIRNSVGIKDYILVRNSHNRFEFYKRKDAWESLYIVAVKSGRRTAVFEQQPAQVEYPTLSPDERFVIWFNSTESHYFSYEISTGAIRNISDRIPYPVFNKTADIPFDRHPYQPAGWLTGDKAVLLYDHNDIWQTDLGGKTAPICLTNDYGKKHQIVFRIASDINKCNLYHPKERLILAALNEETLDNGYWLAKAALANDPELGTMGPYLCFFPDLYDGTPGDCAAGGKLPEKLRASRQWIISRETVKDGYATLLTSDFKKYRFVAQNRPPQELNWLTSELIRYRLPDSTESRAILYKPENFDSTKKYPTIFKYYERRSGELHMYQEPYLSAGEIKIPYLVSNGYLVCVPDIYYQPGEPCRSAVTSVEAAANYLTHFSWVDRLKLAVHGHSFGGYETNCIITHSNLFAAACEAAGPANTASGYSQFQGLNYKGKPKEGLFEHDQMNMLTPPYANPQRYIENSPVFQISQITAPLLIMHNKEDSSVAFSQALEMFIGMRRAGKPVWILQYDGMGHIIYDKASLDFTIKSKEFFDHYLKGTPIPSWMNQY